jgi:hypothetical protein
MIWIGLGLMPGNNSSGGKLDDLNRLGSFLGAMAQSNADQGPDVRRSEDGRAFGAPRRRGDKTLERGCRRLIRRRSK